MAKVEIKKPIVDEIIENLNGAQAAVLVDYRGLTVEQDTQLRKQLREAGTRNLFVALKMNQRLLRFFLTLTL